MAVPKLFVIRVWLEPTGEGGGIWRACVTNTRTGERRYFKDPGELVRFLHTTLAGHLETPL